MKNLQATREHLYLQAGLNDTAHTALRTFEALVYRVAELEGEVERLRALVRRANGGVNI